MKRLLLIALATMLAGNVFAFELSSPDPEVKNGRPMIKVQEYNKFGCNGDNLSPELLWKDAPAGTRSFAITVYDPDAKTGSGFWHWVVYNIPATELGLPAGVGVSAQLPIGAKQGRNDFGERNFSGACPPAGERPHHYIFTVHALKVDRLTVPEDASAALVGFNIIANRIGLAKMTTTYSR